LAPALPLLKFSLGLLKAKEDVTEMTLVKNIQPGDKFHKAPSKQLHFNFNDFYFIYILQGNKKIYNRDKKDAGKKSTTNFHEYFSSHILSCEGKYFYSASSFCNLFLYSANSGQVSFNAR